MFSKKSAEFEERLVDLIEVAHDREAKAYRMVIDVLVDQVEYLRAQVAGSVYISQATKVPNPSGRQAFIQGPMAHLSEEEQELYALRESGRISDFELQQLEAELGLDVSETLAE